MEWVKQISLAGVVLAALLPVAHAQEGRTLGAQIQREYTKDTTDRDVVIDINRLIESLKNEHQLSPETRRILEQIPAGSLEPTTRALAPKNDVDIEYDSTASPFDSFESENPHLDGDIGFELRKSAPKEQIPNILEKAFMALNSGQTEVAAMLYKKVLYEKPDNPDALFGLATAYQRNGQIAQARSTYSKLLEQNPSNWPAMNNFLVLAAQESPDQAIAEFKRLARNNPEFAPIPAQIGMIYYKQGKLAEASKFLSKAVMLEPTNLHYRYNLAVIFDTLGQRKQAARFYSQIIEAAQSGQADGLPQSVDAIQERLSYIMTSRAPVR